jgi:hypothetical protein
MQWRTWITITNNLYYDTHDAEHVSFAMQCVMQAVGHFTSLLGHIYSVTIEHMKVRALLAIVVMCTDACMLSLAQQESNSSTATTTHIPYAQTRISVHSSCLQCYTAKWSIRTLFGSANFLVCVIVRFIIYLHEYTLQRANSVTASPPLVRAFFDLCYRYLLYCPNGILQGPALRSIVEVHHTTSTKHYTRCSTCTT